MIYRLDKLAESAELPFPMPRMFSDRPTVLEVYLAPRRPPLARPFVPLPGEREQ